MSSPELSPPGTPSSTGREVDTSYILTPRSKIRALVASLSDSDSSSDEKSSPKTLSLRPFSVEQPLVAPPLKNDANIGHESEQNELIEPGATQKSTINGKRKQLVEDDGAYDHVQQSILESRESSPKIPVVSDGEEVEDDEEPISSRRKTISNNTASSPHKSTSRIHSPAPSSPIPPAHSSDDSDDEDLPADPLKNSRFLALVEKKRKEREAREAAEREKEEERIKRIRQPDQDRGIHSPGGGVDGEDSNNCRPKGQRKAGKKALEEMHKETQRIARSMQLAHEARTRKKVTKQSLFEKFNFKVASPPLDSLESVNAFSGITETRQDHTTSVQEEDRQQDDDEGTSRSKADKGQYKTIKLKPQSPKQNNTLPIVSVRLPIQTMDDSDSDLEIVDAETLARLESERERSEKMKFIQSLRRPRPISAIQSMRNKKPIVTPKQLHAQLLQKSRLQAAKERDEKIDELKVRGVIIQTAEEKEREQQNLETLLERARKEALEIKRREKRAEKLEKGEPPSNDEADGSELMESGDEEYSALLNEDELHYSNDEIDEETEESGSEKEDVDMVDADSEEMGVPMLTFTPPETHERQTISPAPRLSEMLSAFDEGEGCDDDDGGFAPLQRKLPRKKLGVVDDDDDHGDGRIPGTENPALGATNGSNIPDIFKNGNQPLKMELGMTQLFAGTMASSGAFGGTSDSDLQKKIDMMKKGGDEILPNSQAPLKMSCWGSCHDSVPDTQLEGRLDLSYSESQSDGHNPFPMVDLHYNNSQSKGGDTELSLSQGSDFPDSTQIPDPTQDSGFDRYSSPAPQRFELTQNSPEVMEEFVDAKKARRRRLMRKAAEFSDEEKESDGDDEHGNELEDAFKIMSRAARKPKAHPTIPFDKEKSEAKGMVHEQAEESEDEYAGIGGASDDENDDSGGEDEMKDLLDDEHQDEDRDAIAAYYAEREKNQDERDVNKLLRDIEHGLLRKKRGADLDLDDSDDEYMVQERRRRAKRRQMAEVRKMLLQDNTLEKIAADPKKAAFFKTLEDNPSDNDDDFLDVPEDDMFGPALDQSQSQDQELAQNNDHAQQGDQVSQENGDIPIPSRTRPQLRERNFIRTKKPSLVKIREVSSI
jgi:mediator of replication checkpoint protein 1